MIYAIRTWFKDYDNHVARFIEKAYLTPKAPEAPKETYRYFGSYDGMPVYDRMLGGVYSNVG